MKPSRLLLRLEEDIKGARTTLQADCLRAERAAYLARIGRFDEVQIELAELHRRYDARPNAEISAWLNLVEGLVIYFSAVALPTDDKIKRSIALSSAVGLTSLRAIGTAWLAQFDYGRADVESMARNVRTSLTLASPKHHSARSRASLVVAQALHLAGRPDLAFTWYRSSRDHAVAEGDDATTSALMHNMGWLRMMVLRQSMLTNEVSTVDNHALMNADSTSQYDALMGDTTWNILKPILRAQVLSLQGDYSVALNIYREHLPDSKTKGTARLQANLLADQAWCSVMVDQLDSARECANLALEHFGTGMHNDDRAAAHSRLAQVFDALNYVAQAQRQRQLANEAWAHHESMQARIVTLFESLKSSGEG